MLRVTFSGGPLDGVTYATRDDQVPATVAVQAWKGWAHYDASEKTYDAGLLAAVTYRYKRLD